MKTDKKTKKAKGLEFEGTIKAFDIDWDKINTFDDIKILLKGFKFTIFLHSEEIPEHFKEIFDRGFVKERIEQPLL